jgi:magnesium transporter
MKKLSESNPVEAFAATVGAAANAIGGVISSTLNLPGLSSKVEASNKPRPGTAPGIESIANIGTPPPSGTTNIRAIDVSPEKVEAIDFPDVDQFLQKGRPSWSIVRWIDIRGLHPYVVNQIKERFGFHTLAAEDVLRTNQRPKVEEYENCLFVVQRMIMLNQNQLHNEQVSFFLFADTLITFQETEGDVWDGVRSRLEKSTARLRKNDPSYLLYALLDAVVDHCFPILERYGEQLEELEGEVMGQPSTDTQRRIQKIKRELAVLRRVTWPTREILNFLERGESPLVSSFSKTYMRDVSDHTVQIIEIIETYRENASGLNDLYMSVISNRMNEIMKVLTIMASLFIPVTFVAGVYGMNFEYIPELAWQYSYPVFWGCCISIVGFLLFYFYRKGWIGRD